MSKPMISFGLKKSGLAKPATAVPRMPTAFSNAIDEDGSGDERTSNNNVVEVSELDAFGTTSSTKADTEDTTGSRKKSKSGAVLPAAPPTSKKQPLLVPNEFTDLSSALTSRKYAASAEEADPSIYDYDAAYDSFKAAKKAAAAALSTEDKRPRYFDALQRAADIRERDRQIAEERRLQRERAAEGDAYKDKEKFVTEAYRRQQEELRRLREEEERREEEEKKKNQGRGLAEFYKGMLERGEREHAALVKAAEEGVGKNVPVEEEEDKEKSATERAKEINAMGGNVLINEEGEVVDKRQLLKGGLNVTAKKTAEVQREKERRAAEEAAEAARRAREGSQGRGVYAAGGRQAARERQTRMLAAQLEETLKRSRQEEEEEAARIQLVAKSRKTEADVSSAKERYLARKRAAEQAKKKGLDEMP